MNEVQGKRKKREVPIESVATPEGTSCQHCEVLWNVSSFGFYSGGENLVNVSYCHTCWLLIFGYLGSSIGIDLSPIFERKTSRRKSSQKGR